MCIYQAVYQSLNAFFSVFGQRARGGLNRIGHHQNRLFARKGVWPGVREIANVYLFIGMLVLIVNIEVLCHSRPVMGEDKLANKGGQVGFLGHFHSFGYVTDDDARAFFIGKALVWVHAHLVFGEECGGFHLPDVVIKCTGTHQQAVCPNAVGYLGSKVGHGDGMLERAWSHLAHLPEQAFVGVGEFEKRHTRSETEGAFDNIHQRIGQQQQHTVGHEVAIHARLKVGDVACLHQLQRKEHQEVGQGHEQRTFEQLCPTRQVAQRINGHQATD